MRLTKVLLAVLASVAASLAVALPASASPAPCPASGCEVFSITGLIAHSTGGSTVLALGSTNSAAIGSQLELRNFSSSRPSEMFMEMPVANTAFMTLALDGGALCVTGWKNTAVLEPCSTGLAKYQDWQLTPGHTLTDPNTGRSLVVSTPAAYAKIMDSTTSAATWMANAAT